MNWFDRPVYDDVYESAVMDARLDGSYYDEPDRPDAADVAGLDKPIQFGRPGQCQSTGQGWEPCDRDKHDDGQHWCRDYGHDHAAKWDDDGHYERRQLADLKEGSTA